MDVLALFQQWLNGIKLAQIAHLRAATYYRQLSRILGIPVTVLSVMIGTSIFSSLSASENQGILIFSGIISLISSILSGLQTFLNYPELAEKHESAGIKYSILRRYVEELIVCSSEENLREVMSTIRDDWDKLQVESPQIARRFHEQALKMVKPSLAEQRGVK